VTTADEGATKELETLVEQMDQHYRLKRYEAVLDTVRAIYRLEPEHDYAMYLEAWSLCCLDRFEEALSRSLAALARQPYDTDVISQCVALHRVQGNHEEALRLARSAVELKPGDAGLMEDLASTILSAMEAKYGTEAYRGNNKLAFIPEYKVALEEGIELMQHAVKANPENGKAFSILGKIFSKLLLHDQAEESYRAALELNPQNLKVLNHFAHLLYLRGRNSEAQQMLETVLMLDSSDESALYNLNNYQSKQGSSLSTIINYHQVAVRLYPASIPHQLELVRLMMRESHSDTLLQMKAYLKLNPGDMEMNVTYGQLLFEKKEYKRAIAHFDACRQKEPDNPFVLSWLEKLSGIKKRTIVIRTYITKPLYKLIFWLCFGIGFPFYMAGLLLLLLVKKAVKMTAGRRGSPRAAANSSGSGHAVK
jgi:Flp pilus assembly protein TadD